MIRSLGVTLALLLMIPFVGTAQTSGQCNEVMVSTKLMNWRNVKGVKKYVESGKWDTYDENGSVNPMPDRIDILVDVDLAAYYLKHAFSQNEIKTEDFNLKISAKLKLGESTDCINVLNPVIIDVPEVLFSQKIDYNSFFKHSKYQPRKLKAEFELGAALQSLNTSDKMLNQIIIIVTLTYTKSLKECVVEYIRPVLR